MTEPIIITNQEPKIETPKEPTLMDLFNSKAEEQNKAIQSLKEELEALKSAKVTEKPVESNIKKTKEEQDLEYINKLVNAKVESIAKNMFVENLSTEQKELLKKIPNSEAFSTEQLKAIFSLSGNSVKKNTQTSGVEIKENNVVSAQGCSVDGILKAAHPERYKDKV